MCVCVCGFVGGWLCDGMCVQFLCEYLDQDKMLRKFTIVPSPWTKFFNIALEWYYTTIFHSILLLILLLLPFL